MVPSVNRLSLIDEGPQWGMKTRSRGQDRAAVVGFESGRPAADE